MTGTYNDVLCVRACCYCSGAVGGVRGNHHYTNTSSDTVAAVLQAGMDTNCDWTVDDNIYRALVNDSTISEADVDSALGHLLSVRFRLGEFDDPATNPYTKIPTSVINSPANQVRTTTAEQNAYLISTDLNERDSPKFDRRQC